MSLLILDDDEDAGAAVAALHVALHLGDIDTTQRPAVDTLHGSFHLVTVAAPVTVQTLHLSLHLTDAYRIVADTLHTELHLVPIRSPSYVGTLHLRKFLPHIDAPVYAGAPYTYPGGFPAPVVPDRPMRIHLLGRDGHDFGELVNDRDRLFEHVLKDTGNGEVFVRLDNPLFDELKLGRILSVHLYDLPDPVFDFLIEPGATDQLTQDEEAGQGKTVGGRGTLAVFDEAVAAPLNLAGPPVEKTMVFDFSHPAYVEQPGEWVDAKEIADQGNNPTVLWKGKPAGWLVLSSYWIWSDEGTAEDAPGPATKYFRKTFDIQPDGYVLKTAADNAYAFSMNGVPIVSAGDLLKTTGAFWQHLSTPIDIPDGENVFGIVGQNYAPTVPGSNPAGVLAALLAVDTDGVEIAHVFSTNSTWHVYNLDGAPTVTVGMVLDWWLRKVQARGGLEHVTWDFTADADSAGELWERLPRITLNIGDSGWTGVLLKIIQAGLADLRMVPGSPLALRAYKPGTWIPDSTADFTDPVNMELHYEDPPALVNAWLVQYDSGFVWVEDETSIAENGRVESYLSLGNMTGDEAVTRAQALLETTKDPGDTQITVMSAPIASILPYKTYGVGSLVPVRLPDGSTSAERVMAIAVRDNDDQLEVVPRLRSLKLDDEDRVQQWLSASASGFASGIFQGDPNPPHPAIPGIATANESEMIHQAGSLRIEVTPRHPFHRTGTARYFYVFVAGLLGSDPITADCYIGDTFVCSATCAPGERRSALVMLDPPARVVEHSDWWHMAVTEGVDGSDVQGHLIIR